MTTKNKQKVTHNIRTIEEYIKAKKRLSTAFFTALDVSQIMVMKDNEFFIINNCKIPIKSGTLDLTQWTNKHKKPIIQKPLTVKEKKELRNKKQKEYREKRKAQKLLTDNDNEPEKLEIEYNITEIFRFKTVGPKSLINEPKRLITAIRLSKNRKAVTYQSLKPIKKTANIPIQSLLKTAKWLNELSINNGSKSDFKGFNDFIIKSDKGNKHYQALELTLKAVNGQRYLYSNKGLILIQD